MKITSIKKLTIDNIQLEILDVNLVLGLNDKPDLDSKTNMWIKRFANQCLAIEEKVDQIKLIKLEKADDCGLGGKRYIRPYFAHQEP